MQHLFTRRLRTLLLTALFLFSAGIPKAWASHYAAVDLFVDFIGTDSTDLRYRVTLQLYKGCEGVSQADPLSSETVAWSSVNAGFSRTRSFQRTNLHVPSYHIPNPIAPFGHGPNDTLDQLCGTPMPLSLCFQPYSPAGPNYPGFVRTTYIDTVTLPARASDWQFSWTSGSRNNAILNLQNPSGSNIYCEAGLNNIEPGRWNNSTPRYMASPVQSLCVNQPDQFMNSPAEPPADTALDSMYTSNVVPQNGPGNYFANYNPPYSLANPIGSPAGYWVHPVTGTAFFYPNITGRYVLAFRTDEYDKATGVRVGYIRRDVQVNVINCGTSAGSAPIIYLPPVSLTGGTQLADSVVAAPVGGSLSLGVSAKTAFSGNNLRFYAANNYTIPGSQFSVTYQMIDSATGHFTWMPTVADTGTRVLPLVAVDSSCMDGMQVPRYTYRNLYLQVYVPVGVGTVRNPDGVSVWPNPAKDVLQLRGAGIVRADIYTVTGQPVASFAHPAGSLSVGALVPGMYIVRLTTGRGSAFVRFTKE